MTQSPLTPDGLPRLKALVAMQRAGMNYRDICQVMGISKSAYYRRLETIENIAERARKPARDDGEGWR